MNTLKKLFFFGAIFLGHSLVACTLDVPPWYLAQIEAARPTQLLLAFESFEKICADETLAFDHGFADTVILRANVLRQALIEASNKDRGNDLVGQKIGFFPSYIFAIYFNHSPFSTLESNKALEDLHYTVLYYDNARFRENRVHIFRSFRNRYGDILTPQEFAASKRRLSGKSYFRYWSRFFPDCRVAGCQCSIS